MRVRSSRTQATIRSTQCCSSSTTATSTSPNMDGVQGLARLHLPLRRMLRSTSTPRPCHKDSHSTVDARIHAVWTVPGRTRAAAAAAAAAATCHAATPLCACTPLQEEPRRLLSAEVAVDPMFCSAAVTANEWRFNLLSMLQCAA